MDPTQTPRAVIESNAPRPLSMQAKQNRTVPAGYHIRSPGPSPGLPRYSINNGATVGPRLSGRPPPELQRHDSRSILSSSAGQPNQFTQQRPTFIPPRSQITSVTSSATFTRALLPPTNPANLSNPSTQFPFRYPNSAPLSNIRGPSYSPSGQRSPFNPQQFLRPQRPGLFETGVAVPLQTRYSAYPQSTDNRPVTSRIIPENVTTTPQNSDNTVKITKTMASSIEEYNPHTIRPGSSEKMENNEPNKSFNVLEEEHTRDDRSEMNNRRQTSSINNRSNNQDHDNDTDDDDVIMDMEKDSISYVDIKPATPNIPNITGSAKTSTPSSHTDVKLIHEEQSNPAMILDNSPITNNQVTLKQPFSKSQMNTGTNALDVKTQMMDKEDKSMDNTNDTIYYETKSSGDNIAKIPTSTFTGTSPDALVTLPIPVSLTPSPDPTTGVMGYDNGQLRSLSPNSNKSLSPAPPKIPSTSTKPIVVQNLASSYEHLESTDKTEMVIASAVTGKSEPLRTLTPKDPHTKPSTFRHPIESGDGDDNGTNSTVQSSPLTANGLGVSPTKKLPTKLKEHDKSKPAGSPVKSPTKSVKSLPRTPESGPPSTVEKKKVPMNKVQVGAAPSPNLKTVRSKIGSLDNTSYKPGGGKVKIENRKLDFSKAQPKIAAKNDKYAPSGGDKKITQVKLQWNAKPKVGSLDNATYKPGGGDKKIETVKLDFKDKAKPKVGSKDNAKHVPGGGTVKSTVTSPKFPQEISNDIETQKIDIKAESKVGSMDNMKHKPGGGDKKIFNDRDYLRQTSSNVESVNGSGAQDNVNELNELKKPNPNPPPSTPTRTRTPTTSRLESSVTSPITASAIRTSLRAKSPEIPENTTLTPKQIPKKFDSDVNLNTHLDDSPRKTRSPSPNTTVVSNPPSSTSLESRGKFSSSNSSKKTSPHSFHLPELMNTMSTDNMGLLKDSQEVITIKLPKLIETSTPPNKFALAQ